MPRESKKDTNAKSKISLKSSLLFNLAALLVFFSCLAGLRYLLSPSEVTKLPEEVALKEEAPKEEVAKEEVVKEEKVAVEDENEKPDINLKELRDFPVDWKKAAKSKDIKIAKTKKTKTIVKKKPVIDHGPSVEELDNELVRLRYLEENRSGTRLAYQGAESRSYLPEQASSAEPDSYLPYEKR